MTISKELETSILRYHHVEQWSVGTIAKQLSVHHSTVNRVLSQAGMPKMERTQRPSIIDPYIPFMVDTLKQYPKLTASRLYSMVKARGYPGAPSHFRQWVAQLRPRPLPEAYLRLKTLPGEQAQVDWGHFGYHQLGRAKRSLMAFVMVLSWSRQIFLHFFYNAQMANFLRGHVGAFEAWQGLPKVLLYDNLKSAVLERRGDAIRFHPTLLDLSAHYGFTPRPVAVARGNEKGRVERAIRYIRDNFFAARQWQDLDDLNAQARTWCWEHSADRDCPEDRSMTVKEAFNQEQTQLLALPDNAYACDERVEVSVGKTPYVRFDLNDYSLPHTHVRRTLTVEASLDQVRVVDGQEVIAQHRRSYQKGQQIEDPRHVEALTAYKHQARLHRGQDRLIAAVPSSAELLKQAAQRGHHMAPMVATLLRLVDAYGAGDVQEAVEQALQHGVVHGHGVQLELERRREQRNRPPPLAVALPDNPAVKNLVVRTPSLTIYDDLDTDTDTDQPTSTASLGEQSS